VKVEGFDVLEHSLEVRKHIGYLPEHNSLYLKCMLKNISNLSENIQGQKILPEELMFIIDQTGLEQEQHKRIGSLSKGFRQRVE